MALQEIVVKYKLPSGWVYSRQEWEEFKKFSRRLSDAIERADVGEFDGHDVGEEMLSLYAYGPDADSLYAVMDKYIRELPMRPATVELRHGDVHDPHAETVLIDL